MGCIADDAVLPDVCGVLARFEDRVSAIACRMERSTLDGVV